MGNELRMDSSGIFNYFIHFFHDLLIEFNFFLFFFRLFVFGRWIARMKLLLLLLETGSAQWGPLTELLECLAKLVAR